MCGIVGIVERDSSRPVTESDVERMVRTLNHRGPDEEGSVLLPGVGLAMRRLAIVDIAGGQQPFANEDGSMQVVANGEIYNFPRGQGRARRARPSVSLAVRTSRCWSTPTRNTARRSSSASAACSRWRCGTAARAR